MDLIVMDCPVFCTYIFPCPSKTVENGQKKPKYCLTKSACIIHISKLGK